MDVSSFVVTNAQAAELVQPDESSFYDPPPSAQSAAVAVLRLASQGTTWRARKPCRIASAS